MHWDFPYASQRMPVMAGNVVATSQPLAAQAGLRMLLAGGNAVDAAIATAIALTVVEPCNNGIGGDAFAIVWDGRKLHGLNSSGRSPRAWTRERFDRYDTMPLRGWDSVTVPGAPAAWTALSKRFGRLDFEALFQPAIEYARDGFVVSPRTAEGWAHSRKAFAAFPEFIEAFCPRGRAPRCGEYFAQKDQARTLRQIARTHGEAFYRGALAKRIAKHAKATGGVMTVDDLAAHEARWVDTIAQPYAGCHLHEIPPNGQGLAALIMLGILKRLNIRQYPVDSADSLHAQIEAMKLAFADAHRYIADPAAMRVSVKQLLSARYLKQRAALIDMSKAQRFSWGELRERGTVYLAAADARGMMVSMIQSNYHGFGSGVVIPGTGIAMQNRGAGFTLERGHANEVGGGKQPYHTIIPGFVMRRGEPVMAFGVMGGPMQPQGHAQMMVRIFDYGQNPQAASDAPRWRVIDDRRVAIQPGLHRRVYAELSRRGHKLERKHDPVSFGGAQLIYRLDDGYVAASDWRKDGQAVGYCRPATRIA